MINRTVKSKNTGSENGRYSVRVSHVHGKLNLLACVLARRSCASVPIKLFFYGRVCDKLAPVGRVYLAKILSVAIHLVH